MFDFDTGYEGKFDFPGGGRAPETFYMLASIPRSGSSYVSHLLWETGCLGAPLEYLNFDGPYAFARDSADLQLRLWRSVLRRRTSPNGVFGFKCFSMQLDALQKSNPALLAEALSVIKRCRVIYLRRRDSVAQAISYARATQSGVWRKEQESDDAPTPDYSAAAIADAERSIDFQSDIWARMFGDLKIEPLSLWYEDVLAAPDDALRQVAAFIGATIDPAAVVPVPVVARQSESQGREWAARYAAEMADHPNKSPISVPTPSASRGNIRRKHDGSRP